MMPKEIMDLIMRVLGPSTNTDDIEAVSIEWDVLDGTAINIKVKRP